MCYYVFFVSLILPTDEDTGDTTRTSLIMHPHPFGGTVVEHA